MTEPPRPRRDPDSFGINTALTSMMRIYSQTARRTGRRGYLSGGPFNEG